MAKIVRRYRFAFWIVTGLLLALGVAGVTGLMFFGKTTCGKVCVRCGAQQFNRTSFIHLFGWQFVYQNGSQIQNSKLTEVISKRRNGCQHDWTSDFVNTRTGLFGLTLSRSYGDSFPGFRYPAASQAEPIADAIEWLETSHARAFAMEAIGDRNNLLRLLAAGCLVNIAHMRDVRPDDWTPSKWWQTHSNCFTIHTNANQALDAVNKLREHFGDSLGSEFERTEDLIREGRR